MSDIRQVMLEAFGMVNESVYDKLKFKAVFLAGGPGSGKSFILSKAFPDVSVSSNEEGHEMYQSGGKWKVVNSDHLFVRALLKFNLPLKIVTPEEDPAMNKLQQDVRGVEKQRLALRNIPWLNSMLPIIIDGTCKNSEETLKVKEKLESIGYDTFMLFVDTAEDVASKRNASRKRSVPDDFLRDVNRKVRSHQKQYKDVFDKNFEYVDNTTDWRKNPEGLPEFLAKLKTFGQKAENPVIQNPIGRKIVQTLEANGGAYLADFFATGDAKGKSGAPITNLSKKDLDGDGAPGFDMNTGIDL